MYDLVIFLMSRIDKNSFRASDNFLELLFTFSEESLPNWFIPSFKFDIETICPLDDAADSIGLKVFS